MPAPGFKRGFKRKRKKSPRWLVERVERYVTELRHSDRPEEVGNAKNQLVVYEGRSFRAFAIELTGSDRLIFGVDRSRETPVVILDRVCNHKAAYGKD